MNQHYRNTSLSYDGGQFPPCYYPNPNHPEEYRQFPDSEPPKISDARPQYRRQQNQSRLTNNYQVYPREEVSVVSNNEYHYIITLNVKHFGPQDISVKIIDGYVVIEGRHGYRTEIDNIVTRQFKRHYVLPRECTPGSVSSSLSSDGVLTVIAPRNTTQRTVPVAQTGPAKELYSNLDPGKTAFQYRPFPWIIDKPVNEGSWDSKPTSATVVKTQEQAKTHIPMPKPATIRKTRERAEAARCAPGPKPTIPEKAQEQPQAANNTPVSNPASTCETQEEVKTTNHAPVSEPVLTSATQEETKVTSVELVPNPASSKKTPPDETEPLSKPGSPWEILVEEPMSPEETHENTETSSFELEPNPASPEETQEQA